MIDIPDEDVVLEQRTSDGRFLIFHKTNLPPKALLPWSGVMLDTGGDGHGIVVRPDPIPLDDTWTAVDLLSLSLARAQAEEYRRLGPLAAELVHHLGKALHAEAGRLETPPPAGRTCFLPGLLPSPYPWTDVVRGPHDLPLCPDSESREDGISPEQVLMILAQLYADGRFPWHQHRTVAVIRNHLAVALDAERRRVAWLRQGSS